MSSYSVGVDLGGTNLRIAAFTPDWERMESVQLRTRVADGTDAVVGDMCAAIRKVIAAAGAKRTLVGVGLGSPGPLELPAGRLCHLPNFPGWDGFELKRAVEAALGMPVAVESDANAAALAEWALGAGRDNHASSMCMITLGTGVGNGIILDGKIWHGANGMAGEAGHVSIEPDGPMCGCGGQGCLEVYASATGLRRMAREMAAQTSGGVAELVARNPEFRTTDLAALAEAGDRDAVRLFEELGRYIGLGLGGLVNTLNLPLYVVGGGLASAWPLFAESMRRTMRHYSYVYRLTEPGTGPEGAAGERPVTRIVPATLGTHAGLLGAAMLPYGRVAQR